MSFHGVRIQYLFAIASVVVFACSPADRDGIITPPTTDSGGSAGGGSTSGGALSSGGALGSGGSVSGGSMNASSGGALSTTGGAAAGGAFAPSAGGATSAAGGQEVASGGNSMGAGGSMMGAGGTMMGAGGALDVPLLPLKVFIAGDSTVSEYADTASTTDQAGWGQMIHELYDERVTVENHAIGGRTARRFIDEGRLDAIWDEISAGDFLLVQFGTNDGHKTATYEIEGQTIPYYLEPATDFKTYLQVYIEGALARDVRLVLVTPPPRNSAYCTGGNGTGAHAQAMRELGVEEGVGVADLNQKSVDYLMGICPAPTPEDFFLLRTDGSVDGTHFQENGARILSSLVVEGIGELGSVLDDYRL